MQLLSSDARHIQLRGGSRSGKTFVLVEAILIRAMHVKSRHAIMRFRANALKSITGPSGTLYAVLDSCFPPEVRERSHFDKKDNFLLLPNGSEIWFGGLDDKERVEKILGNEFVTLFFNECSQIPYQSHNVALTRLAQKVEGLRQKAYYDENPPNEGYWTHRLFLRKQDPDTRRPLTHPDDYASMQMNPEDNRANLDPDYLESLKNLPERQRRRFYEGQYGDAGEAALWTSEIIDQQRVLDASNLPQFLRVVVAVDPSGADDIEDAASDEIGIGVAALGTDGRAYILEDLTMKGAPKEWGEVAADAYDRHDADYVIAEGNFGGAMVRHVIQTAKAGIPYKEVSASRGKHIRAEPVSALFEQDKVRLVGRFPDLEDEMLAMTTAGYTGSKSPNRVDWMVWAVTELFPKIIKQAKAESGGRAGQRTPTVNLGHSAMKRRRR